MPTMITSPAKLLIDTRRATCNPLAFAQYCAVSLLATIITLLLSRTCTCIASLFSYNFMHSTC